MKQFHLFITAFFCIYVISCNKPERKESLTKEELVNLAIQQGDLISENTQKILGSTLKRVIKNDGIPQALKYCNVNAYPIVDSLQNVYKAKIRRVSLKARNPNDTPNNKEENVINEYQSKIENGKTPEVKVVLGNENVDYYKPIILSADLCLNCHGEIGSDITDKNHKIIEALYSNDNATGYKIGDLRGIWSIRFERDSFLKD